jgi:hypothetical protein
MATLFIKLVAVVTTVTIDVVSNLSLYFLCKTQVSNINKEGCVHHFDANVGGSTSISKTIASGLQPGEMCF